MIDHVLVFIRHLDILVVFIQNTKYQIGTNHINILYCTTGSVTLWIIQICAVSLKDSSRKY